MAAAAVFLPLLRSNLQMIWTVHRLGHRVLSIRGVFGHP
jgi:hypothetical protein